MAERPNALALKASVGKTTGGSNPSASAQFRAGSRVNREPALLLQSPQIPTLGLGKCPGQGLSGVGKVGGIRVAVDLDREGSAVRVAEPASNVDEWNRGAEQA